MKNIKIIVVTGGPCGGKTSLIPALEEKLKSNGWHLLVVPETATEIVGSGISRELLSPIEFQNLIVSKQIAKERFYMDAATHLSCDNILILCDRGILDGAAFLSQSEFSKVMDTNNLTRLDIFSRYDAVVHLTTAAKGAREYYNFENQARIETAEESIAVDDSLLKVWSGHPTLIVIKNYPCFSDKINETIDQILSFLNISCCNLHKTKTVEVDVDETFLSGLPFVIVKRFFLSGQNSAPDVKNTIRMIESHTDPSSIPYAISYFFIEITEFHDKSPIKTMKKINQKEYLSFLKLSQAQEAPVKRYNFVCDNHYFQLDKLVEKSSCKYLLTMENDEKVSIPQQITLKDGNYDK